MRVKGSGIREEFEQAAWCLRILAALTRLPELAGLDYAFKGSALAHEDRLEAQRRELAMQPTATQEAELISQQAEITRQRGEIRSMNQDFNAQQAAWRRRDQRNWHLHHHCRNKSTMHKHSGPPADTPTYPTSIQQRGNRQPHHAPTRRWPSKVQPAHHRRN